MSRFYNDYEGNDLLYMEDYLEHFGRKGQKPGQHLPDVLARLMAIGHRPRRSRAQKQAIKRRRKTAEANRKQKEQAAKRRQESLAKARATAKKNAPRRKELDKIVRTGSAADIFKVANELTPKQKQQALDQLRFKQQLGDLQDKEIAAGNAKYNSVMNRIGKFAETSGKVFDAAGKGIGLVNALRGESNKVQRVDNKVKDNAANDLADVMKRASNIINNNDKKKK